jgi:hypothetical protein
MSPARTITERNADPRVCPLCGGENVCAMAKVKADGTEPLDCWCADASFPPERAAHVQPSTLGKACICAACAARYQTPNVDT